MITPDEYLMGRDKECQLDMLQAKNMANLLSRVNYLLAILNIKTRVTSGYRPAHYNKVVGGAKMSTHTVCAGIDLADPLGDYGRLIVSNKKLLEEVGLCLENPLYTKGWIHLDTRKRTNIIFNP